MSVAIVFLLATIVFILAAIVFVLPQPSAASERRDCPTDIGRIEQGRRAFSAVMTIKLISWFETIIANPAISVSELETIISSPDIRFKEVGGSLGVYKCSLWIYINKVGMYLLRLALLYGCAVKVGGTSRIKINEFILYSLRFALPLDKVGCVSTMPNEKTFVFSLHCLRLALPLHLYGNKSSYYGGSRKAERAY